MERRHSYNQESYTIVQHERWAGLFKSSTHPSIQLPDPTKFCPSGGPPWIGPLMMMGPVSVLM